MKPLKDIGREVVELSDMEFVDPDTVDWGDEPETPKFTVYSIDERRELVREAIRQWELYKWKTIESNKGKFTENPMEAFVRDCGL